MTALGGIVLCGGQSTRMGQPKAWLPFGPETMLARIVRLLAQAASPIVVVHSLGQTLPPLTTPVLWACDERPQRGPLEAMQAGLRALAPLTDAAYITSCDVPFLSPSFVRRMKDELHDADIAVPVETPGSERFHHPLAGVYRVTALPAIEHLLANDKLRVTALFDEAVTRRVPVESLRDVDPELLTLRNLNEQEDYAAALRMLSLREL